MAEIVLAVAAKVAEFLVDPVARPLCYLRNYKSNMVNLMEQIERLIERRAMVEFAVEDAIRQGEVITRYVLSWLDLARKTVDMASKVIQDGNLYADQRCCKGFCPNLKRRYKLSKKARWILMDVVELLEHGKFDTVSFRPALLRTESTYSGGYVDLESRRSTLNGVLESLRNPEVSIVGVWGMGGIGKTSLVKEVARRAKQEKLFDEVIFVDVSQTPDTRRIQLQIADQLGAIFHEETVPGRAHRVNARLKKVKKVLLILDNLWGRLDLEIIGIPFGNDHKGCKLLLTSRSSHVLYDEMYSQRNFEIRVLEKEDAWNQFRKVAGVCVEQPDLQPLAFEVASECGGLPIAIVTIAKALRNRPINGWEAALRELRRPSSLYSDELVHEAYKTIELSYKHLESEELKSTFLLCSMMENDASIEDLLRYAMGLGIFQDIDTMEEAQDRAATLVHRLQASSLLQVFDNKRFSMHDIIRDAAISIASSDQRVIFKVKEDIVRWDRVAERTFKTCIAMSLHDIGVLPERLVCPQLEFFCLKTRDPLLVVHNDLFTGMPRLKVLHFIGMALLSLPTSLSILTNLQTLCMDQCKLRDVGVIKELRKLEILRFRSSDIEEFPREISELTQLRLLDMSHCSKLEVIGPDIISCLTRLEVLYMGNTSIQWEFEGKTSLAELKCLPHLTTLEIHIRDAELMPEDLFSQMHLKTYEIVIGDDWNQWDWYEYETARMLKLSAINVEKIWLDQLPVMGSFVENLTCLVMKSCGKLRYLFSSSIVNSFVQLQYLEICECTVLEEIIAAEELREEEGKELILPQLNYLKMNDMEKLRILYSGSCIEFPLLKKLEIANCPGWEACIFNEKVEVPILEKMVISYMDNLKTIWDNQLIEGSFCKLRSLEVNDCQMLLTVFPSCICERLSTLESLTVKSCGLVEQIFDLRELSFDEKYFSEATQLTDLYIDHLPNLKHIWNEDPYRMLSFEKLKRVEMLPFEKLKRVTVFLCPNLKTLFPASAARRLFELKFLEVSDCGVEEIVAKGGEEVPVRIFFPLLSSLQLHCLPELRTFYPGHTVEAPCLEKLSMHHCDQVKVFISEFHSFSAVNEEGQLDTPMQQPFLVGKDFPNLEELQLSGKAITLKWQSQVPDGFFGMLKSLELNDDKSAVLPLDMIQRSHRLEKLSLNCGSYKKIFSYREIEEHAAWMLPRLRHLVLSELYDLKQIWKQDSKAQLDFQNLETLEVRSCVNLINLMPSSASFQNLKTMEVWGCEGLKNLLTSSTAKSLVQLEKLEVFDCKMMTEVVANEGAVTGDYFHEIEEFDTHVFTKSCKLLLCETHFKLSSFRKFRSE